MESARADSERFFSSRKFRKRRNTVCISRFQNCTDGAKDSPPAEGDLFRGSPSSQPKSKGLLPWQKPLGWVWLLGFLLEEVLAHQHLHQLVPVDLADHTPGVVLGDLVETNFRNSMVMSSNSLSIFVTRPFSLLFLALAVLSIGMFFYKAAKDRKSKKQS